MVCPKCKSPLSPGAVSCPKCGTRFKTKVCPYCKSQILSNAVKCPRCGKVLSRPSAQGQTQTKIGSPKKPITKRWWFWALCVLLVLGIIGNIGNGMKKDKGRATPTPAPISAATASPTPSPSPSPSPTPEPSPDPTPEPTIKPVEVQSSDSAPDKNGGNGGTNNFDKYDNPEQQETKASFVLNTNSRKVHYPKCKAVKKIAEQNYAEFYGTLEEALAEGYERCGICMK